MKRDKWYSGRRENEFSGGSKTVRVNSGSLTVTMTAGPFVRTRVSETPINLAEVKQGYFWPGSDDDAGLRV